MQILFERRGKQQTGLFTGCVKDFVFQFCEECCIPLSISLCVTHIESVHHPLHDVDDIYVYIWICDFTFQLQIETGIMPPGVGVYLCRMDGYGGVFERTVQLRREYTELIFRLNHMYDRLKLIPDKREKSLREAEWIRERDRSVACMRKVICNPPTTLLTS